MLSFSRMINNNNNNNNNKNNNNNNNLSRGKSMVSFSSMISIVASTMM